MEKKLSVVKTILGCCLVLALGGCATLTETLGGGDTTFVHQDPDFSITFSGDYEQGIANGDTVARFEYWDTSRNPNYSIRVYESMYARGKAQDSDLNRLPDEYSETLKHTYPTISDLTILEKRIVTLTDGSRGIAWKLKWKWTDKVTYLQSAAVAFPRGNQVVSCFGTDLLSSGDNMESMLNQCRKLTFTPPKTN